MNAPASPLAGIRIIDLTRQFPGPLATLILGDLGADVIKVEDPSSGDSTRYLPPVKGDMSAAFLELNRAKRSLAVNLKNPEGRDLLLRLVATADVVVEGFRPGVIERLGIGYEVLQKARSDIILCSISGYGQNGPDSQRAGHDINYCARAGVLDATGERNGPPAMLGVQLGDTLGGSWQALAGILGALFQRERCGQGQWLDVAMADGALSSTILMLAGALIGESLMPRGETFLTGGLPGYGIFETADGGHLSVGAIEMHFFDALCRALGLDHLQGHGIMMGEEGRAVKKQIADKIKTRPLEEWNEVFKVVDACVEPVIEGSRVVDDQQFKARNMFFTLQHPSAGPLTQMASPLKLMGGSPSRLPAPRLGEHTTEILGELGLSPEEIEKLFETGTVGIRQKA